MNIKEVLTEKFNYTNGIYFSSHNEGLSYPEEGNNFYYKLEDNSYWFNHRNQVILLLINTYFNKREFLDIGGGNGFNSLSLQESIENVYMLEPGFQGCLNAQSRGVTNIICSTLSDLIQESVSFDSIGLFDVLEHINDDIEFLNDINKVLENEGHLILTVPAFNFLWSKEDVDAGHYRRYKKKELVNKIENAGFSVEFSSYFFSILTLPIFFFRAIPSYFLNKSQDSKSTENQHKLPDNFIGRMINAFLRKELIDLKKLRSKRFGSSLIIVAKKI